MEGAYERVVEPRDGERDDDACGPCIVLPQYSGFEVSRRVTDVLLKIDTLLLQQLGDALTPPSSAASPGSRIQKQVYRVCGH